ncbi:Apolipoprotein N-acyltransferase [Octadecabacter ascidiaceicola]|uniref:Apolipoprotein N-acyltransferase n=2 Tax=Octadecabacter ascidiaceicola TaxID=1655543 RepID=A0A238KNY3_9RHOB|nr:Apolipoprotein N-acyltransferase [Octadecabacter ascidiaceicola]
MTGFLAVSVALALAFLILPVQRRAAAWFGWLLGLGYFGVTLRWLVEPFLVDPVRHGWMAPFAIFFMAGGLALFWALAVWGARWIVGRGASVMIWLPVTLAAAELARGHILSGFPWGLLSYTLIGGVGDVWFAWVGPYGTNFLLLALVGGVSFCLHKGWTLVWPALVGVLFVTIGVQALTPKAAEPSSQSVVRIIQPNAPQHQKWDREWMPVFFDRAIELTASGATPNVVIWPETSVPAMLNFAQPWTEQMSLAAHGAPVVAGIQRRDGENYFNSAILIDQPESISAISDKVHLVPFGEYIPLAWLLKPIGLGTLVDQVAGFSPGVGDGLMQIDGLGLARVLICYEGIFPEEMQRGDVRPDVLLILTNDAWFGKGAGPRQHLVQAQARAIEQGLPVVRAANTGISAIIDPRGNITESLPLNEAGYLDAFVPGASAQTLYAKIGDWPLLVLLCLCIMAGIAQRSRIRIDGDGPRV